MADGVRRAATVGSLRVRLTAVATLITLALLGATGVALAAAHHRQLVSSLDGRLQRRAADLRVLSATIPISQTLLRFADDDIVTQVVAADGRVIAASAKLRGLGAIAPRPGTAARGTRRTVAAIGGDARGFRLLSLRTQMAGRDVVLHLGADLDDVHDSMNALELSLFIAMPGVTCLLAVLVWVIVGRTLRPVEVATQRQREFVADASHELRTPLARLRAQLEVERAHPSPADRERLIDDLLQETVGMQRLVDDLLFLARSDAGVATVGAAEVDLDDIAFDAAAALRAEHELEIDVRQVSGAQVIGDRSQLMRVVRNLADNAARHARSFVRFELAEAGDGVRLAVVDDGPGIPPEQRERIFERFNRLDPARAPGGDSTGLGLAIARDIVIRHHGSIAVDPDYQGGARMVVVLPRPRGRATREMTNDER